MPSGWLWAEVKRVEVVCHFVPPVNAKIMDSLIPHSKLYIFHDGYLGLGTSAQELVQVVDQFLSGPLFSLTGER